MRHEWRNLIEGEVDLFGIGDTHLVTLWMMKICVAYSYDNFHGVLENRDENFLLKEIRKEHSLIVQ